MASSAVRVMAFRRNRSAAAASISSDFPLLTAGYNLDISRRASSIWAASFEFPITH